MTARLLLAAFACTASLAAQPYCFGFLNAHPERKELPQAEAAEIQKGHMAHMNKRAMEGHLLAAGPILTPGGPRGILIYKCESVKQAESLTMGDPAVENKRLTIEMYRWRTAPGIGEPLMTKLKADPNAKYEMVRLPLLILRKARPTDGAPPKEDLREHGNQVAALMKQGKIRAAGPFLTADGGIAAFDKIGVFVFAAMPLEEAQALIAKDKLVTSGYASVDAFLWMVADEVIPK